MSHTKPFICEICKEEFAYKVNLDKHKEEKHGARIKTKN